MSVTGGIRTIKVGVLTTSETAMTIVVIGIQSVPCVAHDPLNCQMGDWALDSASLLPVVEECIVEGTHALGSIGGHEDNLFDRL